MSENQVLIRKPFNEQYTLIIDMESMIITALLKSKTQARYDFSILDVRDNFIECRLVQLDLFIEESNSDLVKEISQVTAAFNRMFNELHLKLNKQGEIVEVLNMNLILSKWEQTKKEMQNAASVNEDIKRMIIINDNLFTQPEKIKTAIKANEFLQIYFGKIFGKEMPAKVNEVGTNPLNTTKIDWLFSIKENNKSNNLDSMLITSEAIPVNNMDSNFCKTAYQQFTEHMDFSKLSVELKQNAEYQISQDTGRIIQSQTNKVEKVNSKLYIKLNYTLICDKIGQKNSTDKNFVENQNTSDDKSSIIDTKEPTSQEKGSRWVILD